MAEVNARARALDTYDLPKGLEIKRQELSFEVTFFGDPRLSSNWTRRAAAFALGIAAIELLLRTTGLPVGRTFLTVLLTTFTLGPNGRRRPERSFCYLSPREWVWRAPWRDRFSGAPREFPYRGADPRWVTGIDIEAVFPRRIDREPTWRIRLHLRLPEVRNEQVAVVVDELPNEGIARDLVAELRQVYRAIGIFGELRVLEAGLPGVRIEKTRESLIAGWDGDRSSMTVTDGGITRRSKKGITIELDVDAIDDVALAPGARRGSSDLVAHLKKGGTTVVLGVSEPPCLGARVLDDVRRRLRLP